MVTVLNFAIGLMNLILGNVVTSFGHPPINSYLAIVSLSVAVLLLLFLVIPLNKKINSLEKERKIRE
jgi:hypothetical protein